MFNRYKSEQTNKHLLLWYLVTSTRKEVIYRGNTYITLLKKQEIRMTKCKQCGKRGKQETVRCDICLSWMCWDCSLVNEEQQIYVEKSEDVHGLFWSCQTCIVNKLDVLTELKKIKEQLEQEIEEMRMKIKKETREDKEEKEKTQIEECKGKQKIIVGKEVIINVQEEQIEKLNDECNNNNKKIESLEKENNTLKGKLENCNPTEGKKEENMSKMKELTVKNKELEAVSRKRDKELNHLKEELLKYNEKTQNLNEEAGYQKEINKILINKVRDIEKLNETLELTLAKKEDDREEAVIVNKQQNWEKNKI